MLTKIEQEFVNKLDAINSTLKATPAIVVNGLTCEVRPIRRHKLNPSLVWIETPLGNQWADAGTIKNLDLGNVPWD